MNRCERVPAPREVMCDGSVPIYMAVGDRQLRLIGCVGDRDPLSMAGLLRLVADEFEALGRES